MLRVGLTGGIASGKTRVRRRLEECGLATFDLDHVANAVIEPGRPAHADIVRHFGGGVLAADGRVDRRALGAIVFENAAARDALNAIVHPRVFDEEERLVAALPTERRQVVVTDGTLLVESGHHVRFDRLVVTACRPEQQVERLVNRDGLGAEAARARLAAQMPAEEKRRYAHHVVDTSRTQAETDAAAVALAGTLRAEATAWCGPRPVEVSHAIGCLARGPREGPRGLTPLALAQAIAAHGWPPLPLLAHSLVPPASGPWYAAGQRSPAGPGPETLMAPVFLWSRARHGDLDSLLAAAVSMARLTHAGAPDLARAATAAVAFHAVADSGRVPPDLWRRVEAEAARVVRWAGAPPEPWDAQVQGALDGLAEGAGPQAVPAELAEAVRGLCR